MTGVEILTMEEVVTSFAFNWTAALISGFIIMVLMTLILVCVVFEEPGDCRCWIFSAVVGLAVGLLFGVLLGFGTQTPTDYKTQYKVAISDEVQLNEFNEKYEIIEQDGKIYTVREKE